MKKIVFAEKSNLEKIKDIAKEFLFFDIKVSDLGKIILLHPVFESAFQNVNNEIIDITESDENLRSAQKKVIKFINMGRSFEEILFAIRQPYQLIFLILSKQFLSEKDFSEALGNIWTMSENPNDDKNVSIKQSIQLFKESKKEYLMNEDELEYFINLPEEFVVYRGVSPGRKKNGLSWTKNKNKAEWFMHRFETNNEKGYLLSGIVLKKRCVSIF